MKKKLIIILLSIFLLTGCNPKFTYSISDGSITEQVEISFDQDYTDKEIKNNANYYGIGEDNGYTLSILRNDILSVKTISKKSSLETFFNNSNIYFKRCFDNVYYSYDKSKKRSYIGTSEGFKCMYFDYLELDSIDVSIKTFNKVYENNADESKFGVYTWHFNKENASNKKITFVVGNSAYVWYYKYRFLFIGLLAIGVSILVFYLITSIFKTYSNKANKI